ncbi:LysM peptidoglycan-binding domain-containing protein [Euzebya rosea]|uniref:LysM peptidoglycan-binding domain-containing protein n=1 Tax=Euzebya rosea TaxID=2052804 RepID=UPI00196A31F8|nr:LysM domain-containing protein [Euzebya rosea]
MSATIEYWARQKPPELMVVENLDGGPTLELLGFDAEEIQRQGGDPIWETVARPHRKTARVWVGNDAHERRLDIEINRTPAGGSVLGEYDLIRGWQGNPDAGVAPPRLRIRWGMWQQQVWQVDRMVWGPMDTRADGHPTGLQVTIDLVEAVDPDLALTAAEEADAATTDTDAGQEQTYVVRPGDTLSSIAAALLGGWEHWTEIAALNGIVDPRQIQAGQELRIP